MKKLLILFVLLTLAGGAQGENRRIGTAGAQFLKIGVGSRYQGMAEASVATANDVYAMYWNPAGLVEVENWAVSFTNVNWLLDVDLNYAGIARHFEDVGTFGVSVTVLSTDAQEITTVLEPDGTGSTYDASSYAIGLSFARQLTARFAFGGSVKFLGEHIGEVDSRGVAADFGTLLYTGFNSLRLGMSVTNMGPDMEFAGNGLRVPYDGQVDNGSNVPVDAALSTTPYNLPMTFRVGLAYDVEFGPRSMLTLSSEFKHPNDNERQGAVGTQFAYDERFFLRGGYKIN
ncbi:MAG: PorV/PorQ family protein, partial [candidate division Zixibacteria bacterium]|nr:PorV/PorQ family protein [candidate division Zixibacteria bacterium]